MEMPEAVKQNRKNGRPSKLTPDIQKRVIEAIEACGHIDMAAAYAGIARSSFNDWLRKGARAKSGVYKQFSDTVQQAIANAMMERVNVNRKAANGYEVVTKKAISRYNPATKTNEIVEQTIEQSMKFDARAAEWWLERRFPYIFGRKEQMEMSSDPEKPLVIQQKPEDMYGGKYIAEWMTALAEVQLMPAELLMAIDVTPANGNGSANGTESE